MRVKALRLNYYSGKEYGPNSANGDEYDMDDREAVAADVLERIGIIKILRGEPKPVVKTAAPPPASAPSVEATTQFPDANIIKKDDDSGDSDSESPARKRFYRKREE